MGLRKRHGNATKYGDAPVLETLPVDELPVGVPEDARQESPADRGERGLFAPGNALAAAGGRARAGKTRLADRLTLQGPTEWSDFNAHNRAAVSFRRAHTTHLARTVGGGFLGPAPSSFVASGALQLAWSRYYFELAAKLPPGSKEQQDAVKLGSALAEASSTSLRHGHEYAAKEAEARAARRPPSDATDDLVAALAVGTK